MGFTKTEQEILVLKAVWELIDEMVNFEIFATFTNTEEIQLLFNSATHQRLFNILLVDFLSQPRKWPFGLPSPPDKTPKSQQNLLHHIVRVSENPTLNTADGDGLRAPVVDFVNWLESDCLVEKVWFPSINVESDIRMKRLYYIKICGNIAKHGFTRLNVDLGLIRRILAENNVHVDDDHAYLVAPEFYEWFHRNIFSYHASTIAEFLNNIRWGIYEYLKPEFARSFTKDDPCSPAYRFISRELHREDCQSPLLGLNE